MESSQAGETMPPTVLVWSVRESFLDYISALDDTDVRMDGQVFDAVPDSFTFPVETMGAGDRVRGRGCLTIVAHGGLLDVRIEDPGVTVTDDWVFLDTLGPSGERFDLAKARRQISGIVGPLSAGSILDNLVLTLRGAEPFGTAYGPGARLAPVILE